MYANPSPLLPYSSGRIRTKTKKSHPPAPSEDEDERDNSSDKDHYLNFATADFAPKGKGKASHSNK